MTKQQIIKVYQTHTPEPVFFLQSSVLPQKLVYYAKFFNDFGGRAGHGQQIVGDPKKKKRNHELDYPFVHAVIA